LRLPNSPHLPIVELNTTPLIDVLLVLLVMLIITIPPQTHAVKIDLPNVTKPKVPIDVRSKLLTISADGALHWTGSAITRAELRQELAASRQLATSPELHLQPDQNARHADVDDVLITIKREQIRRFGFVGNERFQHVF